TLPACSRGISVCPVAMPSLISSPLLTDAYNTSLCASSTIASWWMQEASCAIAGKSATINRLNRRISVRCMAMNQKSTNGLIAAVADGLVNGVLYPPADAQVAQLRAYFGMNPIG